MQRYILDDKTKTFYKSDLHHIKNVMRMKDNDELIICLEKKCYLSKLDFHSDLGYLIIRELEVSKSLNITLIQGMIKGTKIDTTVKYTTIFGVKKIVLIPFDRSIAKNKNADHKVERLFSIAKEATELSHREAIPKIDVLDSVKEVNWNSFDYILLADEEEKNVYLDDIKIDKNKKIAIIIGPEGGISDNERKYFKEIKAISISLGKYIFPAEIAAISILNKLS